MAVPGAGLELARVPIFSRVDAAVLTALEPAAFVRRLARGQILFVAGEPSDHLFVVRSGSLKVHIGSELGAELLLAILGPGQSLGEIGVIDRGPRSADVTALSAAELLAVPGGAVRSVLEENPAALLAVAEGLAAGIRRLTQQAADLVFLDLPRRLAKLLLDSAAERRGEGTVAALGVNQSELAAMMGVTRQSLNRALSSLSHRGWVQSVDRSVRIVDVPAMRHFVET